MIQRANSEAQRLHSSYRDPSGFIFRKGGEIFRQVNPGYKGAYERLLSSGLYDELCEGGLMVAHAEIDPHPYTGAYKVLRPEPIPFISYPYEWCFSQLKDAALLTLEIQARALEKGMYLKDASAYNVQFRHGRPVFIDTLSFECYQEGLPWAAYRQFCEHFLMPLAIAAYRDQQLLSLQKSFIEGIPLPIGTTILPFKARLRPGLLMHLFLHAGSQTRHAGRKVGSHKKIGLSLFRLQALIDSLRSTVASLRLPQKATVWGDYYAETNYSEISMAAKKTIVERLVAASKAKVVLDLGANTGVFSRIAAKSAELVVSTDFDALCIEKSYLQARTDGAKNILPLVIDVTSPSPPLGWRLQERPGFFSRFEGELVMALALIHHLAIGRNLPLPCIAHHMSEMAAVLVIEFVPKEDSQVQRLLANREDIFPCYTRRDFEEEFARYFDLEEYHDIPGSARTVYLMRRKL